MKINVLRVPVDKTSYAKPVESIMDWASRSENRYVCVSNVHMLMEEFDSSPFRQVVTRADLVTADGMPLVWVMRNKGARRQEGVGVPPVLYILFPSLWVMVFATLSIYDGRKFLRAADELAALFLATLIASVSAAGIVYFSFRDVSRALYLIFVATSFLACLTWRVVVRSYFRLRRDSNPGARRLLIVGTGPLGQRVEEQLRSSATDELLLVGFVDHGYAGEGTARSLGEIGQLIHIHRVTDVIVALPYSAFNKMTQIVSVLETSPVEVWIALGFFDLALYRTDTEDFAGIPMLDLRASAINDYPRIVKQAIDVIFVPIWPDIQILVRTVVFGRGRFEQDR